MSLTVLLGGARSGKSRTAQSLASRSGQPVTYVATATVGDDEMAERIDRHRRDRPQAWTTVEEPVQLRQTLEATNPDDTIIIDCLTLWLNNVMERGSSEADILSDAAATATSAAARQGETIVVTNEVGLGLVPSSSLGRQFRDLAGRVNQIWVEHATRSGLVIAGRVLPLIDLPDWKGPIHDH
ncbi:MAG: bifunctional adenosylcobinamide kinase/adenosylcobinamide-phosphate guanylyltransferase [Acidimicrobiia bacterium]|nr:bifunctional adenosylcobinamide kinase/adenosylcobinamide-phosphate guanylyltransferase [Acidimicrobiia bacterium]